MDFAECPSKWIEGGEPEKDSDATEWGTLLDALALDADRFTEVYAVAPATCPAPKTCKAVKTGKVKEGDPIPWNFTLVQCQEWRDAVESQGKKAISFEDFDNASDAVRRLLCDDRAFHVLRTSQKQVHVTAEYHDRKTGIVVPFKILIDLLPPETDEAYGKSIIDLKTCRDASLRPWLRSINEYGYDWQAATYLDVFNAVEGADRCEFRHLLSENVKPWQPGLRIFEWEWIMDARNKYVNALEDYCQCLESGKWPSYERKARLRDHNGWAFMGQEAWMMTQEMA